MFSWRFRCLIEGLVKTYDPFLNVSLLFSYSIKVNQRLKMVLATDVYYKDNYAKTVGVLFDWDDTVSNQAIVEVLNDVEEYVPGEFYRRELPCILKLLEKTDLTLIDVIVVDGHVYTDNNGQFGLGGKLWEALQGRLPVIGVAKTSFLKNKETVMELRRGKSGKPLYISAIGIELDRAVMFVKQMHGNYRMPDILKKLDGLTKET